MKGKIFYIILAGVLTAGFMTGGCGRRHETVYPAKQKVVDIVVATGRIRPEVKSDISAELSGTIEKVNFKEGDRAARGDVLFELDTKIIRAKVEESLQAVESVRRDLAKTMKGPYPEEINRARAELRLSQAEREKADADFERFERLLNKDIISKSEWEMAKKHKEKALASEHVALENLKNLLKSPRTEDINIAISRLRQAEAAENSARKELEKHSVRAPYDCTVISRNAEAGQVVTPGGVLMTVADMTLLEIYVETDENNLGKISISNRARVIPPAFRDSPFESEVSSIGPEIDSQRGVVGIKLTPVTVPDYVLPNMTVDVNILTGEYSALTLPASAVIEIDSKAYVLVPQSGGAAQKEVKILSKGMERIAVEGISENEKVMLHAAEVKTGKKK